jgi:iron complex outermembrane receptor protein
MSPVSLTASPCLCCQKEDEVVMALLWLAMVVSLTVAPRLVGAQSRPPTQAPVQLPQVEVRDERLGGPQLVRDTSTFATVVDTSDATARVESIADVLAETVGVQVRRFGGLGAFSTVSIRGSTPSQVEVYLDNVLLNRANAGLVDLGNLPLDNVERIEIYRGFAPLHLGAGSIGGAINLVTRPVAQTTTNVVSGAYGSFDTRKFTLYRSQGFDTLGYLVLFNYTGSDNDFEFLDDNGTRFTTLDDMITTRRNNDFDSFSVNAKGEAILAKWTLTLSDDFFTKDQGVPGQTSLQSDSARLEVWRNIATLRLERKRFPFSTTDIVLQLAHTWEREDFKDLQGEIGFGVQDNENTSHTFSANGLLNLYVPEWGQIVGLFLEWRYETFRSVSNLPELRGEPPEAGPLQRRANVIVALQDEILLFKERLSIRPLLRYQFVDSNFGAQPSLGPVQLDTDRKEQEHLFSPSIGIKYRLTPFLDLKGNVGRFVRVPTFFELFGDRGTTLGNPELDPESSVNWDLGFIFELRPAGIVNRLFLEYAYFANDADDLIVFVQNSQATAQAQNINSARIRGHEVSWSVTAWRHLRLYGNYTFQDTEDTSNTFSRGNALPGRPRHELHQAVELFANLGKIVYEVEYIADNFLDRANAFVVDSRLLHNVSVTVLPLGKALKLTFEAKNITDNQIEDFRGFPLPGRSFFGTVEGRF